MDSTDRKATDADMAWLFGQPDTTVAVRGRDLGLTKKCPKCDQRLVKNTLNWAMETRWRTIYRVDERDGLAYKVREQTEVWATYCRPCTTIINREKRRGERERARLRITDPTNPELLRGKAACACCGKKRDRRIHTALGPVCRSCNDLLNTALFDLDMAKALWFALRSHLADELRLDAEAAERTDRPRKHHSTYPPGTYPPHTNCVLTELEWRKVVTFLVSKQE